MPGSLTSCVNCAVPFDLAFESVRGTCLPMNTKSFASLSLTLVGTGSNAAAADSSPKLAFLPFAWNTTPFFTWIESGGTFHCFAAAATSIARAAAPACRYCSNELAMDDEPPVICAPKVVCPYRLASAGAPVARICDHAASSSSATSVGSPV